MRMGIDSARARCARAVHSASVAILALTGAIVPSLASAQLSEGGGRVELGAVSGFTRFDATALPFSNDFGVGIRAGWFFTRALSLEVQSFRTVTAHATNGAEVDIGDLSASVMATLPAFGRNRLHIGAGWVSQRHTGWAPFTDQGVQVLVGDRIPLSRLAALRLDARALYTAKSQAPTANAGRSLNFVASIGVSIFAWERPPKDSDSDLIPDRADACPDTPRAASVDARGCPRDTDGDRVFDGIDRCPSTAAGVPVDAEGCMLDSDGDGVSDDRDQCPATEAGVAVDAAGCMLDEDGDRIPDARDRCPRTTRGAPVNADGCEPDADADGVPDRLDRCPATPSGTPVNDEGCVPDTDGDGVPDHLDKCPGTTPGQTIDAAGCLVLFAEKVEERKPLVLRGVNFEFNSAVLTGESSQVLSEVAASLMAYPEVVVEVAGHTDNVGVASTNRSLSLARALSVRAFLIAQGVPAAQLLARGFGPDQPVASNRTEAGRAQNRRVELRLVEQP